ncbi:MAG: hypothetical protein V4622_00750 [Bacteroidota bacterium]
MKSIKIIFSIFTVAFLLLSNAPLDNGNSSDARINTYKYECKQLIKPARYEGSRITYYNESQEEQKKSIETFFLLDTEYKLAFSGKECSTKLNIKIYDSADENKRVLLKEIKSGEAKNTLVSSKDLSATYAKKVTKSERLKVIYIEYTIAAKTKKNEAVVLVIGYKDI